METNNLKKLILEAYGIDTRDIIPGPLGFVAQTYIITTKNGDRFFVKYVDKPLFIKKILKSLAVQNAIHEIGFERMNYPIRTLRGDFYILQEDAVLSIYNYIDAPQSYDYDLISIGRLEAKLHQLSTQKLLDVQKEEFHSEEALSFPKRMEQILENHSDDLINKELTKIFKEKKAQFLSDYDLFLSSMQKCREQKYNFVITHGDAGGNTLVKTPTDLYLIDWDEIILAPAERDVWTLWDKNDFKKGYTQVAKTFRLDPTLNKYYILSLNFTYIIHYINEIQSERSIDYRQAKLEKMSKGFFNGWILPFLQTARKQ